MSEFIIYIEHEMYTGALEVAFGEYGNGRVAIELLDPKDHQPWWVATINLVHHELKHPQVFLKGWSENSGLPQALERAGLVELTGTLVPVGYAEAHVANLTELTMMHLVRHYERLIAEAEAEKETERTEG